MHHAFGRAYFNENGEEDLGVARITDYMSVHGYEKGLKPMLEEAGFENIRLESEPISLDDYIHQYVIVAEKVPRAYYEIKKDVKLSDF